MSADTIQAIAAMIREYRRADRDALLCAIISRFPHATGEEIQKAIDAHRGGRPVLCLPQGEEPERQRA